MLLGVLLAGCSAALAQNLWERMGASFGGRATPAQLERQRLEAIRTLNQQQLEARRAGNPTAPFAGVDFEPLHRVVSEGAVSLKPMLIWRNAGQAYWGAYQPFTYTNPLPGWTVVEGRITALRKDATTIRREADTVALLNWPGAAEAILAQPVRVLAVAAPRYVSGKGALAAYDYGARPTEEQLALINQQDAAMEAARAAAAARDASVAVEAEAKRKAEIAAKVEKARAERAAKEKLDGK